MTTTVIEFPHRSKPVVSLSATLRPRRSKAVLLKAAHATCRQDDPWADLRAPRGLAAVERSSSCRSRHVPL